jgi:DNA-directed RNA polymerase subunit E'/Rpb7
MVDYSMEPESGVTYAREDNRKLHKNDYVRHRVVDEGTQNDDDDRDGRD